MTVPSILGSGAQGYPGDILTPPNTTQLSQQELLLSRTLCSLPQLPSSRLVPPDLKFQPLNVLSTNKHINGRNTKTYNYGNITQYDLEDNDKKIKGKWDATTPIDLLFDQIKDAQDYTSAAGQPYTATQLLPAAYNLIYATGLLFDDCKEWNRHPPHLKTTDNFKVLFKQVQHELHDQHHTAKQAGFQANRLWCNPTQQQETPLQEIAEALANLATATASDRQALQNLTNTVKELSNQIKVKDKEN